ncbi:MAG: DUF1450 domain-containing protein [Spirochaetaceae bacterium]|nr:DUF1450 domain-containing protein [Spirochaetaceae bacterium]
MRKIRVSICTGTACFVMGASEIMLIEDELPEDLKGKVEVEGMPCLEKCKDSSCGKAPFVLVNGQVVQQATVTTVIEKIRTALNA